MRRPVVLFHLGTGAKTTLVSGFEYAEGLPVPTPRTLPVTAHRLSKIGTFWEQQVPRKRWLGKRLLSLTPHSWGNRAVMWAAEEAKDPGDAKARPD